MPETLMAIDGHSMAFRAYHALKDSMTKADGHPTGLVYGFLSMLANLVRDHAPEYLVVVFDPPGKTFRDEKLETYKATRAETPEDFITQLGWLRGVLEACAIPDVEIAGVEADDVLATCASRAKAEGIRTLIVTGDRDAFQLVEDPFVNVLYPASRGVSDAKLMGEAEVVEKTGVRPTEYVDYAAMRGDASDNLPGVPGVGEKTAAKLIGSYGNIEGILEHTGEQPPRLKASLEENADVMYLNREMMTLLRDVDVGQRVSEMKLGVAEPAEVRVKFQELEFGHNLAQRLADAIGMSREEFSESLMKEGGVGREELNPEVEVLDSVGKAKSQIAALSEGDRLLSVCFNNFGLAIVADKEKSEVFWIPREVSFDDGLHDDVAQFFLNCQFASHNAKRWMLELLRRGVATTHIGLDTEIAAHMLNNEGRDLAIDRLLGKYTKVKLPAPEPDDEAQLSLGEEPKSEADKAMEEATLEALAVAWLAESLTEKLESEGMLQLFRDVEAPLLPVLVQMEHAGVAVDQAELASINDELVAECEKLREAVYEAVYEAANITEEDNEFNLNSPKQLQKVLFEDLGLPPTRKTKTGYSTDARSLEGLRKEHPMVDHLLNYREVEKLRSTYGEGLKKEVELDSRIHATFNPIGARTGRLSSESPNLHNIPVRTEIGKQFRKVFVSDEGNTLVAADYDQIELRCIAHLSEDEALLQAFNSGDDVHVAVAAKVFDVAPAEVTPEQRTRAKAVSYGLAYGMEAFGLAQRLNIENSEAQQIIDDYFDAFAEVAGYMKRVVDETRARGYTETLFGRRRWIEELSRADLPFVRRQAAERQAMNAGIQGLAADIFKVALVRVSDALESEGLTGQIVLQVHDEIILEVPDAETDASVSLIHDEMVGAYELSVPLVVSVATGKTWADAK